MRYYELNEKKRKEIIEQVIENEGIQHEIADVVAQAKADGYEDDEMEDVVEEYILAEYEPDVDALMDYYYNGGEQEWDRQYSEQQEAMYSYYFE